MINLTGKSRDSPRHCPVSTDAIASHPVRNGRNLDRKSSRLVFQKASDLWRATTPDPINISDIFSLREFTAALQYLKPGEAPDPDSICSSSSSFEGYPLQVRHKQDWAEGLSFYYPRLLHCLNQMLAVVLLSQHRVSSSKIVRPRAPCGARCIGYAVSTWSAVCSEAKHLQFGKAARPHLCMDEWNRPTPVRRRLSLTQAARGKPIPTGLALVPGTKARSLEAFSQYSVFHL